MKLLIPIFLGAGIAIVVLSRLFVIFTGGVSDSDQFCVLRFDRRKPSVIFK